MTPATLALGLLAWIAIGLLVAQLNRNGQDAPLAPLTPPRSPAMPPRTDPGNCYLPELAHAADRARMATREIEIIIYLASKGHKPRSQARMEYTTAMKIVRESLEEIDRQAGTWLTPPATYPAPAPIEDDYHLTQRTESFSQLRA